MKRLLKRFGAYLLSLPFTEDPAVPDPWTITVDEVSREEACKLMMEREITFRYTPMIVEFDRKESTLKTEEEVP